MHNLKPNHCYMIVTLQVACPAEFDHADITDGLGEMLRAAQVDADGVVADWRFNPPHDKPFPVVRVGDDPEEGDAFAD